MSTIPVKLRKLNQIYVHENILIVPIVMLTAILCYEFFFKYGVDSRYVNSVLDSLFVQTSDHTCKYNQHRGLDNFTLSACL